MGIISVVEENCTITVEAGGLGLPGKDGLNGAVLSFSADGGSISSGLLSLANSNNISFGFNLNTLTASFSESTHSHSELSFANSNNISFGKIGSTITAAASFPAQTETPVAVSAANGSVEFKTLTFANSNGISWSTSPQGLVGMFNGITTAAQSNHIHGNPSLALTNISGTTASLSNGFTLSLSVPNSSYFGNGNGITFGTNVNSITASHNGITTGALSNHSHGNPLLALTNLHGTTQSNSAGLTVSLSADQTTFENSNGISFGLNGSTLTASHNGLTTAMQSQMSSNYMSTSERNNYFYTSAHTFLEQSHTHGNPYLALTNLSASVESQSNGLTLSLSAPPPLGVGLSFGTDVRTNGNLIFSNSNGVSFGVSGSTVTVSTKNQNPGIPYLFLTNISGSTYTDTAGFTLELSGGGNISLGVSNSTIQSNAFSLGNANGVSFYYTNGSVVASVAGAGSDAGGVKISAGTQLASSGTIILSDSNNISFGLSGQTLTASVNAVSSYHSHSVYINSTHPTSGAVSGTYAFKPRIEFANEYGSNDIGFFFDGNQMIRATHNAITTGALSNHSHGNPTLNLTNLSGSTASGSNGLTLSLSVANNPNTIAFSGSNGSSTASTLKFGVSNGLSFYITNGSIVGSYTGGGGGGGNLRVSALNSDTSETYGDFSALSVVGNNGINVYLDSNNLIIDNAGQISMLGYNSNGDYTTITNSVIEAVGFPNSNNLFEDRAFLFVDGLTDYKLHVGLKYDPIITANGLVSQGSTVSQTINGLGVQTGKLLLVPVKVQQPSIANAVKLIEFLSHVSGTGSQDQIIQCDLYYRVNQTQLLKHSDTSYFQGPQSAQRMMSVNGASATLTAFNPTWSSSLYDVGTYVFTYETYSYGSYTVTGTATAQEQSLWGTVGFKELVLPFRSTVFDPSSDYFIGVLQLNNSNNANVGISNALVGNVVNAMQNIAKIGVMSSGQTSNLGVHSPILLPMQHSSTFSYNATGVSLPSSLALSDCQQSVSVMPLMTIFKTNGTRS